MSSNIGVKHAGGKMNLDTDDLTEKGGENQNIPTVVFIADVAQWLKEKNVPVETAIGAYNQLYAKLKMFESSIDATKIAMKAKIPEIEKTTDLVEYLMMKREEGATVTTQYSLADTVYGTAELQKDGMVCMWLGANVMVEYTCEDAIKLLNKSKESAESRLRETNEEMELIRSNIITTEVNMARIFNHDVKMRRLEREQNPDDKGLRRYFHLERSLGPSLLTKVKEARILVVGAGGIGCELLKNLVMTGFLHIEIVDLDIIDISNLNRQFLFRHKHVGQPKAKVAREAVLKFGPPEAKDTVIAHHGNVKNETFGLEFFEKFDIVFNALDNVAARRHVNRLCIAKGKPLVESGTAGYIGQVTVIKGKVTECYDCQPKATPKQYPICTIRSTPDKPVHCIVWAKELYSLIFGNMAGSMLYEDPQLGESKYMDRIQSRPNSGASPVEVANYASNIIHDQFIDIIVKHLATGAYKTTTQHPSPLSEDIARMACFESSVCPSRRKEKGWMTTAWDINDSARELVACIQDIFCHPERRKLVGSLQFEKDDAIAMRFVAAAANMRSAVFSIPLLSLFDAKGIAGNIIPAIATTNAVIAGLQALKILEASAGIKKVCKTIYCLRRPTRKNILLQPTALFLPSENCFVCKQGHTEVYLNCDESTLQSLVINVLKDRLGINEPSITIGSNVIYEEGQDAEEFLKANLTKKLKDLPSGGIKHGTLVEVDDFSQDLSLILTVNHAKIDITVIPEGFYIKGDIMMQPATHKNENVTAGDEGICQVLEKEKEVNKRKRGSIEQDSPGAENVTSTKRRDVSSVGADDGVKVVNVE